MAAAQNIAKGDGKVLEDYDASDLLVAVRMRELTREGSPFLDFFREHKPERLIALLRLGEMVGGDRREELLLLLQKYASEGVGALIQVQEMLKSDPNTIARLLKLLQTYTLDDLVRFAEARERYREKQKSYRMENRQEYAEKKAAYMREWRAKKKAEEESKNGEK